MMFCYPYYIMILYIFKRFPDKPQKKQDHKLQRKTLDDRFIR